MIQFSLFQSDDEHLKEDVTEVIKGSWSDSDEKAVYESQMTLLQEQLVAAMIENQTLGKNIYLSYSCVSATVVKL